jgi:hypothetical protein
MKLVDICLRKSLHHLERVAERDLEHEAESFIARSNTWPGTRMSTLRRRRGAGARNAATAAPPWAAHLTFAVVAADAAGGEPDRPPVAPAR